VAIPAIVGTLVGGVASAILQKAFSGGGETAEAATSQSLGKEDFLRLLTTQLRNQDPLNPMENSEFVAQTAQFSSLEQLQNMNKSLERMMAQAGGATAASGAGLLGRTVTVNGSPLALEAGRPTSVGYALPSGASSVAIQVLDASGKAVRTMAVGQQGRGLHQVVFDGLDDEGRRLASGAYTYRVAAVDAGGRLLSGASTGMGRVSGFNVEQGELVLLVGDQRVPLSSVVGVMEGGSL
jgi:flagellar basal-body rod modification protein FlgD